jgi:hypothetical protein
VTVGFLFLPRTFGHIARVSYRTLFRRAAAWAAVQAKFPVLFAPVSKILGDKASFTSSLTAGELAIAIAMSFAIDVDPSAIDAFPNLVTFFEKHKALIDATMAGYSKYYVPKK